MSQTTSKSQFFVKNLVRGLVWLALLVGGYILARKYLNFDVKDLLGPVYENSLAIYTIFLASEVIFGIIPPEFFMFWAARHESLNFYIQHVIYMAAISYLAGVIGYYIGAFFHSTRVYRILRRRYLRKYEAMFNDYGGFLIVVAAMTPVPFSGVCMLMGTVEYPTRKFFLIIATRFVRFFIYGWVVWQSLGLS